MKSVFVLHHVKAFDNGNEDVKLIGVYSTLKNAELAIKRIKNLPGFIDDPQGFSIDEYVIDKDHWIEGFVTIE